MDFIAQFRRHLFSAYFVSEMTLLATSMHMDREKEKVNP